jgi:hypothetical protein
MDMRQNFFHICMFRAYVESPPFHTSTQVLIRIQVLKPTINPGVQVLIGIQLLKTDQTNNQPGVKALVSFPFSTCSRVCPAFPHCRGRALRFVRIF